MHASNCEIVVVVVSQHYPTDHDCDDPTHLEELSHDVAEDAEDVGEGHLCNLVVDQVPAVLEDVGAEQSSEHPNQNRNEDSPEETTQDLLEDVPSCHVAVELIEQTPHHFVDDDGHCVVHQPFPEDDRKQLRELIGFDQGQGGHAI